MPDARDTEALLRQNLHDAGCDSCLTEQCMCLYREGRLGEMLRILAAHRKAVLTGVREKQKQIDCLDYLTNQIRQQNHG